MVIYPVIPSNITVHLGAPGEDSENVSLPFYDYIKNVASGELYPTWPKEALKANIYAQISVALNRVYTEYYRATGKNFDITSSPAYDQAFTDGREIFSNISELVDSIYTSYLKRPGSVEPLFAAFCDGVEVTCEGLSQWGSVELAEKRLNAFSICETYYGKELELVENVKVQNIEESAPPIPLSEGDSGFDVESMQIKLNRISTDFPSIPKISPVDGYFGTGTTDAVKEFQSAFSLTADGTVGRATWYKIQNVYIGVKQLATLHSEGIRIGEFPTVHGYPTFEKGMSSTGVLTLQYYLNYIALFVPTVQGCAIDGSFGDRTEASVISFQKTYGLEQSGVVDRNVWNKIQSVYLGMVENVDYKNSEGRVLPFPGRILRIGLSGDDVSALQEYLNLIAETYPSIPKIEKDGYYGNQTAAAVSAFKTLFDLPGNKTRVNAQDWRAITNVYKDLYAGRNVQSGQYPGYIIGEES